MSSLCHLAYPVTEKIVAAGMAPADVVCATSAGAQAVVAFAVGPFLFAAFAVALVVLIVRGAA